MQVMKKKKNKTMRQNKSIQAHIPRTTKSGVENMTGAGNCNSG